MVKINPRVPETNFWLIDASYFAVLYPVRTKIDYA